MLISLLPFPPGLVLLSITQTIDNIINNIMLPALGAGVAIMLAYGGVLWMTSAGSDDIRRQSLGKRVIIGAVVGGAITFLALQLGTLIFNQFQ
jgi:hypothetical protein